MKEKKDLANLSLFELNILLRHIKNGEDHLMEHLTKEQFINLFNLDGISKEQKENVKTTMTEKTGNAILVINTIVTTLLGTWLGTISFLGLKVQSLSTVILLLLISAIAGFYLGYINYQLVKEKAKSATTYRRLLKIQINVLKLANQKLNEKINHAINVINNFSQKLNINKSNYFSFKYNDSYNLKNNLQNWCQFIASTVETLVGKVVNEKNANRINLIKSKLINLVSNNHTHEILNTASEHKQGLANNFPKTQNPLEILCRPSLAEVENKKSIRPWWKINSREMITSLAPTALGGLSFLFIYMDGLPKTVSEIGIKNLQILFISPTARKIELLIGIAITFYFAFIHIYNYYKSTKRNQEIKLVHEEINILEINLIEAEQRLNLLKKIKNYLNNLYLIC